MKRLFYVLSLLCASILFFGCSTDSGLTPAADEPLMEEALMKGAEKPANSLIGTSHADFTFTPPNFWNGTISFEGLGEFGLTFISHDAPRDFSSASPFFEDFIIFTAGTDWSQAENVLMKGWNQGLVVSNKYPDYVTFQANGKITEAYGILAPWGECNWHIKGIVNYPPEGGLPLSADGNVRLN